MTCEEYRPSRRRIAPFSPLGAFSYSVTMASLYSGLNTRRVGRGAGSAAGVEGLDCSSEGVDTYTRISDPALGQEPRLLTPGVSHHPGKEGGGTAVALAITGSSPESCPGATRACCDSTRCSAATGNSQDRSTRARSPTARTVLVYRPEPLEHDLELIGPVTLDMWASTDAPDTDFVAVLVDVRPDGRMARMARC